MAEESRLNPSDIAVTDKLPDAIAARIALALKSAGVEYELTSFQIRLIQPKCPDGTAPVWDEVPDPDGGGMTYRYVCK